MIPAGKNNVSRETMKIKLSEIYGEHADEIKEVLMMFGGKDAKIIKFGIKKGVGHDKDRRTQRLDKE